VKEEEWEKKKRSVYGWEAEVGGIQKLLYLGELQCKSANEVST